MCPKILEHNFEPIPINHTDHLLVCPVFLWLSRHFIYFSISFSIIFFFFFAEFILSWSFQKFNLASHMCLSKFTVFFVCLFLFFYFWVSDLLIGLHFDFIAYQSLCYVMSNFLYVALSEDQTHYTVVTINYASLTH